jgi:hypothetical protein
MIEAPGVRTCHLISPLLIGYLGPDLLHLQNEGLSLEVGLALVVGHPCEGHLVAARQNIFLSALLLQQN